MANKNTKRKNRAAEKTNKRGSAINSERGRWRPSLSAEEQKLAGWIREKTREIYG